MLIGKITGEAPAHWFYVLLHTSIVWLATVPIIIAAFCGYNVTIELKKRYL